MKCPYLCRKIRVTIIAAKGLIKRDMFSIAVSFDSFIVLGYPDVFAVLNVDGEQLQTTQVIKKSLNPMWNESFDMYNILK